MANGYRQSRSPVRAITSVNHLVGESALPRPSSWSESGVFERSNAAPHAAADPGIQALACPECGSALRLELQAMGYQRAARHRPLRAAPTPEAIPDFDASIRGFKRQLLARALEENGGVMTRAAKALGIKYTTFVAMIHRLGMLDKDEEGAVGG